MVVVNGLLDQFYFLMRTFLEIELVELLILAIVLLQQGEVGVVTCAMGLKVGLWEK
jgi:hypothetical protein